MKKEKIIIILIAIATLILPITIYAAYTSIRNIIADAETGSITIAADAKNFVIYTYDDPNTAENEASTLLCPTSTNNSDYAISNGKINCYATKKIENSYLEEYIQLNQLGLRFAFNNTIDVYIRVRIEDSWISTKLYRNGTVRSQVILKDSASLADALGSEDWIYDEHSGYIYYRAKVQKSTDLTALEIKFNSNYLYETPQVTAYTESVAVTIGYEIDIVQANRAETKWDVDLDTILNTGGN